MPNGQIVGGGPVTPLQPNNIIIGGQQNLIPTQPRITQPPFIATAPQQPAPNTQPGGFNFIEIPNVFPQQPVTQPSVFYPQPNLQPQQPIPSWSFYNTTTSRPTLPPVVTSRPTAEVPLPGPFPSFVGGPNARLAQPGQSCRDGQRCVDNSYCDTMAFTCRCVAGTAPSNGQCRVTDGQCQWHD